MSYSEWLQLVLDKAQARILIKYNISRDELQTFAQTCQGELQYTWKSGQGVAFAVNLLITELEKP